MENLGGKISSMGNVLTAGVTAPLIAAGGVAINMASDYEESLNKVDVAFGDASQQVRDFAQTTVDQFGIAEGTALDMAALYGDMATSMNIPREEAAQMSQELVGLAGDLASFKNIGLDEASTALKSIFTGETESLKNLGVVMTQTNLDAFALAEGFGKTTEEMTEAEKVQLRYQYVLAATKNAQGDYARTADGTANSLRTMQESSKELAVAFGQELLPEITPLIQQGTKLIKAFADLDEEQKRLVVTVTAGAAAAGPAVKILGTATTGLGKLTKGVGTAVTDIGKLVASGGKATDSMGALGKVLGTLGPKGMIIGGVVAGAAAIGIAVKKAHDDIIQAQIDEAFGDIKLSAEEVEDVARRLTTTDWTVKVEAAVEAREQLAQFEEEMTSALEELNKTSWKVSVGLTLTEDEKSTYLSNLQSFTQSASDYLAQQGYSIDLALKATFGEGDSYGESLSQFSSTYLTNAQEELERLGEYLAQKVNDSFEDNTFARDQVEIQKIIDQMNGILAEIQNAEYRAKLSNIEIEYATGGFGIDQDSFNRLNEEISKNTQELMDSTEETKLTALTAVELQYQEMLDQGATKEFADKVREDAKKQIEAATAQNVGESINLGFDFAFNTITENFQEQIAGEKERVQELTSEYAGTFADAFEQGGIDLQNAFYSFQEEFPRLTGGAKEAVNQMLQSLAPQKEQLEAIRDQCLAAGEVVPDSVAEGLSNIALWEAMAGSADGMYTMLALQIASSPEKLAALEAAQNAGQAVPEELAAALEMYAGLVYDVNTGMWTQLESASGERAETMAAMLNQYGKGFDESLAQGIADQYGLVYENGKWMVDKAAQGVRDNTQVLKNQATDTAAQATDAMDTEVSNSTVGPPTIATPDATEPSRLAWYDAQNFWSNNPLTAAVNFVKSGVSSIFGYAAGGIVDTPQIALVGEAGDEAIIPLENNRARALDLWREAGERLNAFAASEGRAMGEARREQIIQTTTNQQTQEIVFQKGAVVIHTQATNGRQLYKEFTREMQREVRGKGAAYGHS